MFCTREDRCWQYVTGAAVVLVGKEGQAAQGAGEVVRAALLQPGREARQVEAVLTGQLLGCLQIPTAVFGVLRNDDKMPSPAWIHM